MTSGLVGAAYRSRQPLCLNDVYSDPRFDPLVDRVTGYKTKSMLTVPVVNHDGECIAVIQAINKVNGPFLDEDLSLLDGMGAAAGVALRTVFVVVDYVFCVLCDTSSSAIFYKFYPVHTHR